LLLLGLGVLAIPVLLVVALASIGGLKRRVLELEGTVGQLEAGIAELAVANGHRPHAAPATAREEVAPVPQAASQPQPGPEPWESGPLPVPADAADVQAVPGSQSESRGEPAAAATGAPQPPPLPPAAARTQPGAVPPPSPPRHPSSAGGGGAFLRALRRWFTVGNVPVKVGMLVLLAGVVALLRYANEQGWLQLPVGLRLAGVSLAALAGLGFGWRQRGQRPAFALALQGGAIGVLLLVVFAAFKLYGLVPAAAAFALSIVLIAGLGVLAVLQDSRTMAGLGIFAGFLAPIWLSTGSGSHVALFSYYAVLNAAILGIAWVKAWRALNLLGFVFTWGIGIAWGVLAYTPENRDSTQPFLVLFFAFYLLLPILFARRQPMGRRDLVDGCLVFGTPLVAFSL